MVYRPKSTTVEPAMKIWSNHSHEIVYINIHNIYDMIATSKGRRHVQL